MNDELVQFLEECQYDPLKFVLGAFPWGEGELEGLTPREWQGDLLDDLGKALTGDPEGNAWFSVASGHGIGKSTLISWVILWWMSTRPGCRGRLTAGSESQLMGTVWKEVYKWYNMSIVKDMLKYTNTKLLPADGRADWEIVAIPWNEKKPDSFAGMHAGDDKVLVIYDEASTVADVIWETSKGAFGAEKRGVWLAFGNPIRNTGAFRETFRKQGHRWNHRNIDARDVEGTNKRLQDEILEDYGPDSYQYKVRVKGEFPDVSSDQFMSYELVDGAIARDTFETEYEPLILGCDVARHGDDDSIIVMRRGRVMRKMMFRYHGLDTKQFAEKIAQIALQHKAEHICVDGIGVGAGVVDNLKHMGHKVHDINFSEKSDSNEYFNKRSECWGLMRDWLKDGSIPDDKELKEELTSIEYTFNNTGKVQLEPKKDLKNRIGRSPDCADALSLTFAKPFKPSVLRRIRDRKKKGYSVFGSLYNKR